MKTPLPTVKEGRVMADWVTASLRAAILDNYFAPGEKLDLKLIAEELDVSQTPIREAIRRLEAENFVEVRPHYGAFIAQISPQEVIEIYEVRALLESEIVRQVTPIIPDAVIDELDRVLTHVQEDLDPMDTSEHYASDTKIHNTITSYEPNRLLKEVLEGLGNRITLVRRTGQRLSGPHILESGQEHRQVIQAIRERDAEKAARLMKDHLIKSGQRIVEQMA
jgi:DNA-binding GntR family transcriptional regulator